MTQSQQPVPPRRCPRCGGLMTKPPGSNLYWHADNNHRPCEITNIVEASFAIDANPSATQSQSGPTKGNSPRE